MSIRIIVPIPFLTMAMKYDSYVKFIQRLGTCTCETCKHDILIYKDGTSMHIRIEKEDDGSIRIYPTIKCKFDDCECRGCS